MVKRIIKIHHIWYTFLDLTVSSLSVLNPGLRVHSYYEMLFNNKQEATTDTVNSLGKSLLCLVETVNSQVLTTVSNSNYKPFLR